MESFDKRKREWLDLLLQHAVPETLAQSCIQDVANDTQLIAKIKDAVPGEGAEKLVQVDALTHSLIHSPTYSLTHSLTHAHWCRSYRSPNATNDRG